MKKLLATLLVLALCAPAMAVVTVTTTPAPGQLTITLTADGTDVTEIVGFAIEVTATAGQIDSFTVDSFFDIFMDVAWDMESTTPGSYTYGAGSGVNNVNGSAIGARGVVTLPATAFSVCVGGLGGAALPLAPAPLVANIVLKAPPAGATVDLAVDSYRGGVVSFAGAATVTGLPLTGVVIPPSTPPFPSCADYNLTKKKNGGIDPLVNINDINALVTYIDTNKTGTNFVVAPTNPAYDADYNFDPGSVLINVNDLNAMVNFIDSHKTGTTFVVNCSTCGC